MHPPRRYRLRMLQISPVQLLYHVLMIYDVIVHRYHHIITIFIEGIMVFRIGSQVLPVSDKDPRLPDP